MAESCEAVISHVCGVDVIQAGGERTRGTCQSAIYPWGDAVWGGEEEVVVVVVD